MKRRAFLQAMGALGLSTATPGTHLFRNARADGFEPVVLRGEIRILRSFTATNNGVSDAILKGIVRGHLWQKFRLWPGARLLWQAEYGLANAPVWAAGELPRFESSAPILLTADFWSPSRSFLIGAALGPAVSKWQAVRDWLA